MRRYTPITISDSVACRLLIATGWVCEGEWPQDKWWTHPDIDKAYRIHDAVDVMLLKLCAKLENEKRFLI